MGHRRIRPPRDKDDEDDEEGEQGTPTPVLEEAALGRKPHLYRRGSIRTSRPPSRRDYRTAILIDGGFTENEVADENGWPRRSVHDSYRRVKGRRS